MTIADILAELDAAGAVGVLGNFREVQRQEDGKPVAVAAVISVDILGAVVDGVRAFEQGKLVVTDWGEETESAAWWGKKPEVLRGGGGETEVEPIGTDEAILAATAPAQWVKHAIRHGRGEAVVGGLVKDAVAKEARPAEWLVKPGKLGLEGYELKPG